MAVMTTTRQSNVTDASFAVLSISVWSVFFAIAVKTMQRTGFCLSSTSLSDISALSSFLTNPSENFGFSLVSSIQALVCTFYAAENNEMLKELLETILESLVDHPDQFIIHEKEGEKTILVMITLPRSDMGFVIGKKGQTIDAIRTIVNSFASKIGKRIVIDLLD